MYQQIVYNVTYQQTTLTRFSVVSFKKLSALFNIIDLFRFVFLLFRSKYFSLCAPRPSSTFLELFEDLRGTLKLPLKSKGFQNEINSEMKSADDDPERELRKVF